MRLTVFLERKAETRHKAEFFRRLLDPCDKKFIPKKQLYDTLESCVGIANTVSCSPRLYANLVWRYLENSKPSLVIKKQIFNF